MRKLWFTVSSLLVFILFNACFIKEKEPSAERVLSLYREDIKGLTDEIGAIITTLKSDSEQAAVQQQFFAARKQYKQLEWLAEYYSPFTAKHINGPALEEVEPEDKAVIIQPEGFQVLEPLLFPTYNAKEKKAVLQQALLLKSNVDRLQFTTATLQTTDAHIFDALRLEVFRITALGLEGFDSPIAKNSLPEAAAALEGLEKYVAIYYPVSQKKGNASVSNLENLFQQAQNYLERQKNVDSLNHMEFILTYLNPLSQDLLALQKSLSIPFFKERRALKATAATLFAAGIFEADFYAPDESASATKEKIQLGEKLFYDVQLSKNGKRSCASCHQPQKAFTDGLIKNSALTGKAMLRRNTPTLINAALQPALFYDGRVSYLEDQAGEVIRNEDEMHGSLKEAVGYLKKDAKYQEYFQKAYAGNTINEGFIKNAIASYVRSLIALNAPFDQYMRGDKGAMTNREIQGFNLFMGKGKCATCHFLPLFNGVNPPTFTKVDAEIIGVPATKDTLRTTLDDDKGKYFVYKVPLHKHAFKTPTLRNSALTAPYMHNGVFETLEEVIDFYDRGGGNGLGLNIENQTLPAARLHLTSDEKSAIIAFLKTLSDMPSKLNVNTGR